MNVEGQNTEAKNSHSQLITYEVIEGTPFTKAIQGDKITILMGNYRINNVPLTEKELEEYLHRERYNIMLSIAIIVAEKTRNN